MTIQDTEYDVVVVGGGAAGLGGALMLARARYSVAVVDSGEPRNAPAAHMHGYLTRDGMAPGEFLAVGHAEVRGYGVEFVTGAATAVTVSDGIVRVELADGRTIRGRRALVATGLTDELPELPGLAERWGRDVLHCPFCHGWEIRDQVIGVLSTTPMALHQAMLFRQWSAKLRFLQHTGPALTEAETAELAARDIEIIAGEVTSVQVTDDRLTGVQLRGGAVIEMEALVIGPRFTAHGDLLASAGLTPSPHPSGIGDYIAADPTGRTEAPGVWVAGNVADPAKQLLGAAAMGAETAVAMIADLIEEDVRTAVAARS
ncbi:MULTISPECIES: NAD(P)/FAD-dependent oxidoreductase [unclassified Nocardia]|uniref:NAD(P)/FAD-dependent oxidoreductase n=1 Tax=unclassified Nocardia TaxID=2637762 RepID=UPI001CE4B151|nr:MULTISPECIES: NAD(P)/FAD-dependent oxidoreductase [unclassified Nocardia]